jgi:HEPN domain-containing protein
MELVITILAILLGLLLAHSRLASKQDNNRSTEPIYCTRNQNARGYFHDSLADRWGLLTRTNEPTLLRDNHQKQPLPQRRPASAVQPRTDYQSAPPIRRIEQREPAYPQRPLQTTVENRDTKALISTWRRSIIGLIKMADRNLQVAKQILTAKDYPAAAKAASTAVENISRALIHCYGDKPDFEPCQEEPLKILSLKIGGADKEKLEKAIKEVASIRSQIANQQITDATAQPIVQSASKVAELFKQMIREKFTAEIPELKDACPKCVALDVSTWYFNRDIAVQQCNICHYKWIGPRQ